MIDIHILDDYPNAKGTFEQQHLCPCPFCGSKKLSTQIIHTNTYGDCTLFFVKCNNCGAQGPKYLYKGDPSKDALKQLVLENQAKEDWGLEFTAEEIIDAYNDATC